jgi:predicted RND superfamily exporter protein
LDSIESLQILVDNVPETDTISLVNVLKAIHVDVNISGLEIYDQSLWEILHDECWDKSTDPFSPQCWAYTVSSKEDMVNIAFDTLSPEIRSMLMNEDTGFGETKTLVYANQPYINLYNATIYRNAIDDILEGEEECSGALRCTAINIDDTYNSLLTGGLPVSIDINDGVHKAQSLTTIWTMFILLIAMAFLFRSPRLAIFTMAAVGAVVLWQPLLMRFGGVGVNVFTAMIGTIVFGIGVDDSIHIVDRIKDEGETPAGIVKSVSKTGQTIFETTATTCAGLSAGLFVSIPGLQNFFVLMMVLLVLALLTSSILLPSIIVLQKEFTSRILGKGPWLDFEESGSLEKSSVMDAVIDSNG